MKTHNYCLRAVVMILLAGVLLEQPLRAAVTFTNTPAAVSNLYSGLIKLQVTGLNTGETVVVQKFIDANTNGILDAGDFLVQQFQVSDGQAASTIAGVTNNNVPYDSNPTNGAITVQLNLLLGGIAQSMVGQFLYVLSSPSNHFTPITNLFNVTNSSFAQSFSGIVVSNGTSTHVSNALVFLTLPSSDGFNAIGGAVANNSGNYTITAPPGTYRLVASKSNFVANLSNAPTLTLGAGSNIITNLSVIAATTSISGKMEDTNTLAPLPGMLAGASSSNKAYIALFTTASNGTFSVPVTANFWGIGEDQGPLSLHGYVGLNNDPTYNTSSSSVSGANIGFTPVTALIYGTVTDGLNNPLPGVELEASEGNNDSGTFQGQAVTDQYGNYAMGVVAGNWGADASENDNAFRFPGYVFSVPPWDYNNGGSGSNITAGQAVQANFTALATTYQITGSVKDNNNNPIVGVQVGANATINNTNFQVAQVYTDTNGNYALNVVNNQTWYVGVNCCGGGDCGDGSLPSNYQCPDNNYQGVTVNGANLVVNFVATQCGTLQIITNNLPLGTVDVYYDNFLAANGCNTPFSWAQTGGTPPPGLYVNSNGEITGYPSAPGTFTFTVQVTDNNNNQTSTNLSITIQTNVEYQISGYVTNIQGTPLAGVGVSANGNFYVSTNTSGTGFYTLWVDNGSWDVSVDCGGLNADGYNCVSDQYVDMSGTNLAVDFTAQPYPVIITSGILNNATEGVFYSTQLTAVYGLPPYHWIPSPGSAPLPSALSLGTNGALSGYPTASGTFYFWVRVTDTTFTSTNQLISLTVNASANNPHLLLTGVSRVGTSAFQFSFDSAAGVTYTTEISSDLKNWLPLATITGSGGPLTVVDLNANTSPRYYRLMITP